MPSGYRIEVAPNNRAGCKNKECKDAGDKITKGELRFGSLFTVMEHTSWAYKHWGCVTPEQIKNLNTFLDGDMDSFEGFDELPQELQDKVSEALENGHVADEDWKGDVELNRPGKKGFRQKTPKKKQGKKGEDDEDDGSPKPKKRARKTKNDDDDEDEASAPKKARGRKAAVKAEDADAEEPKPKKGRAKKAAAKDVDDAEDVKPAPEPKKPRRKAAAKKAVVDEPTDDEDLVSEEEAPKAKRGKKAAPQKRGRKKAAVDDE